MKIVSLLFFLYFNWIVLHAKTIYISNKGNDFNSGTTMSYPWKTMEKLQNEANRGFITAGDSILFNCGEIYSGKIRWMDIWGMNCLGGTKLKPIIFSSYGKGVKPLFIYPKDEDSSPENRIVFHFAGVDNIIIDGLQFNDIYNSGNKIIPGNCGIPIYLGAMNEATCNNCVIKNVNISKFGMGIVIIGDYNRIMKCRMSDFVNLKSTPSINHENKHDDYGANAITITGNYNTIEYNIISGAWAESLDYGWNGGAFEFFNSSSFNKISNNTVTDCAGLAEFGGLNKNQFSKRNIFEYNIILNCGSMIWSNISGIYANDISEIYFNHNLVTENESSRFSGLKTGIGIISNSIKELIIPEKIMFTHNGQKKINYVYFIRNNRFKIKTGVTILSYDDKSSLAKYNIIEN